MTELESASVTPKGFEKWRDEIFPPVAIIITPKKLTKTENSVSALTLSLRMGIDRSTSIMGHT